MNVKIRQYKDYVINTVAFGLYIAIQQLILLPLLSHQFSSSTFANAIIFLTVMNIISIVFGNELGNVYVLKSSENTYMIEKIYLIILGKNSIIIFIVSIIISIIIDNSIILIFLVFILSNIKSFITGILRKNNAYYEIMISNLFYCLGIFVGIFFMIRTNNYIYPFLIGELLSVLFFIYKLKRKIKINKQKNDSSEIINEYKNLSSVSLLLNSLAYLDRFLIFPMLGASAMNSYYSTSALSKIISLLVNPINSVMMAKLSNKKELKSSRKFLNNIIIILIISIFLSILSSIAGLYTLYNNYFYSSLNIVIPVGIASGLTITILLLKSIYLVNRGSKELLLINIIYAILLVISSIIFSYYFGLIGFAWANVISRLVQFYIYIRKGIN